MMPNRYVDTLINERTTVNQLNISSGDCRNALNAFHEVQVATVSENILFFLLSSRGVRLFLEREQSSIQAMMGNSGYRVKIIKGGFGAGKTHVKNCLMQWIKSEFGQSAVIISFDIPTQYNNCDLYEELSLVHNGDKYDFLDLYKKVYEVYSIKAEELINKNIGHLLLDIILQRKITQKTTLSMLIADGVDEKLASLIMRCFSGKLDDKCATEIRNCIRELAKNDGRVYFKNFYFLLNEIGIKCLFIFIDDFQNLELEPWNGHRDAFGNLLAEFHESFSEQFNKIRENSGISLYLANFVQGRFWDGTSGENGFPNFEKLKQHWDENHEFEIPEYNRDEDLTELVKKILTLYEKAGVNLPKEFVDQVLTLESVRQTVTQDDPNEIFVPRKIIKAVLQIIDTSIVTFWSKDF
jgi:hypothetical protein